MKKTIIHSQFQKDIFKEVGDGRNSLLIQAVAGSSKTYTILKSLDYIEDPRKDIIFLAFNNSIVTELKERVDVNRRKILISTIHSFCFRMLIMHYGTIQVSENKIFNLALKMYSSWDIKGYDKKPSAKYAYCGIVQKIVNLMRFSLETSDIEKIEELCVKYDVQIYGDEIEHAIKVLEKSDDDLKSMDFVDMIYQPIKRNLKMKKFDYVFVDEVQDLSIVQHEVIKRIVKPGKGKVVLVGDRMQSIYAFAGATHDSFDRLKTLLPGIKQMPLSICYRCAKNIVIEAQKIVPDISYDNRSPDGIVREGKFEEVEEGDWVLCRNTKPLICAWLDLTRRDIRSHIKGKEIGNQLIHMIKRTGEKNVEAAIRHVKIERLKLIKKLEDRGVMSIERHPKYIEFQEKLEVLIILGRKVGSTKALVKRIDSMFEDEDGKPGVILSTIHKAKGFEAKRIFSICTHLIPSIWATTVEALQQEYNLKYVLITRAKEEFVYVTDFDPERIVREDLD